MLIHIHVLSNQEYYNEHEDVIIKSVVIRKSPYSFNVHKLTSVRSDELYL